MGPWFWAMNLTDEKYDPVCGARQWSCGASIEYLERHWPRAWHSGNCRQGLSAGKPSQVSVGTPGYPISKPTVLSWAKHSKQSMGLPLIMRRSAGQNWENQRGSHWDSSGSSVVVFFDNLLLQSVYTPLIQTMKMGMIFTILTNYNRAQNRLTRFRSSKYKDMSDMSKRKICEIDRYVRRCQWLGLQVVVTAAGWERA